VHWAFGAHNPGTAGVGGGAGAGKVHVQDISFSARTSTASPNLFLYCANGKNISKAVLTCRKQGEKQQEYLKVELEDAIISSYQASSGGETPVDNFTLNFSKIKVEYKEQKPDGSLGGPVTGGWNVKTNEKHG
jgi:type VI secretion system secreted protein Hcp